ncbi:hypothetical protein HF521_012497 [Silurus meridionalis]|uniref:Uncharacterized protein n=1 Tax=Silurus meridionalis TaxID=175797 RepID=A0A8T0AGW3_SILME|nr:hypothetical protein HF521_012497 [Silurus meridionalis]
MGVLRMVVCWSCLLLLLTSTFTQSCSIEYIKGRSGFVLNVEDSVAVGATYISNPAAHTQEACLNSCCLLPHCNLVLIEHGGENTLTQCFLFDCLYRNQFICSFSKKPGFTNFIQDSVYQRYLRGPGRKFGEKDKRPIANAGADVVTRAGEVVTLNGIESWDDRNITKYEWTLLSGNNSVVIKNTQFLDQRLLSNLYPGVYRFQLCVTDSAGQSDNASVTILVLTQEQSEIHCLSPYKVGPCRGSFPRWHYNAASGVCEIFTFGGCKPNDNNYLSEQDCSNACTGVTVVSETRKIKPEAANLLVLVRV